jgi:hypothetical protein
MKATARITLAKVKNLRKVGVTYALAVLLVLAGGLAVAVHAQSGGESPAVNGGGYDLSAGAQRDITVRERPQGFT